MLIDIHTHLKMNAINDYQDHLAFIVGKDSLGIHPWDLVNPFDEKNCVKKLEQLKTKLTTKTLAIGECGLDRRREGIASIDKQLKILGLHLDWAQSTKRPVIIHCVRAHSDLLGLLKEKKYKGKILLHDYAGNIGEAQEFLKYDCYFSFGSRLFSHQSHAGEVLTVLPIERLFFETDDQDDFSILDIYEEASSLLEIEMPKLLKLIEKNLTTFFLDLNDISPADVINNLRVSKTT